MPFFSLRGAFGHLSYHLCNYRHPVYNNSKSFADQSHTASVFLFFCAVTSVVATLARRPANSSLQLGMVLQLRR